MNLTRKEAKDRFTTTGECFHDPAFFSSFTPYGCEGIVVTECSICGERIEKIYLN